MIFLIVLISFFGGTDKEPDAAIVRAPSAEACAAKAAKLSAKAEADPEVSGYVIKCVVLPDKS